MYMKINTELLNVLMKISRIITIVSLLNFTANSVSFTFEGKSELVKQFFYTDYHYTCILVLVSKIEFQ